MRNTTNSKSNNQTKTATNKREASKLKKEQYWHEQIDAYRASGKSAKQWSEENKINVHTLASWITKLGMQQNATRKNKEQKEDIQTEIKTSIKPKTQDQQPQLETKLPLDFSTSSDEIVRIKHGAITITAESGYNKETLLSLIQTLLTAQS